MGRLGCGRDDFIPQEHHYGNDLNVFGSGSLFELLCTCRTQVGRRRLADYLLQPVPLEEGLRRQDAVKELRDNASVSKSHPGFSAGYSNGGDGA